MHRGIALEKLRGRDVDDESVKFIPAVIALSSDAEMFGEDPEHERGYILHRERESNGRERALAGEISLIAFDDKIAPDASCVRDRLFYARCHSLISPGVSRPAENESRTSALCESITMPRCAH